MTLYSRPDWASFPVESEFWSGLVILWCIYVSDSSWGMSAASMGAIIQGVIGRAARRCPWESTIHNPLKANIRYQKICWDKRRVCEKREREMDCFITESNGCVLIALSRDSDFMFKTTLILVRMGEGVQRPTLSYHFQGHTSAQRKRWNQEEGKHKKRSRWGQERSEGSLLKGVIMWGIFWGKEFNVAWKPSVTVSLLQTSSSTVERKVYVLKLIYWNDSFELPKLPVITHMNHLKWPLTFNTYEKLRNLNWKSFVTK